MEELIYNIQEKAGISSEQSRLAVEAVKEFVVSKFPMMEGMVENLFNAEWKADDGTEDDGIA